MVALLRKILYSFPNVIEILLLTPLIIYATIETVICISLNLASRLLHKLRAFKFHGFERNGTHDEDNKHIPQKDVLSSQNYDPERVVSNICQAKISFTTEENANVQTLVKRGHNQTTDSENESRFQYKMSGARERYTTTQRECLVSEDADTKASNDKKTLNPPFLLMQRFTAKNALGNSRRKAGKTTDFQSRRNGPAHTPRDHERGNGKKVACYKGKMFLVDSENYWDFLSQKGRDVRLRLGILDSKLRKRRTHKADFEKPFGKSLCDMTESCHRRLKESKCFRITKEQCYSTETDFTRNPVVDRDDTTLFRGNPSLHTDLPLPPSAESKMRRFVPMPSTSDDDKITTMTPTAAAFKTSCLRTGAGKHQDTERSLTVVTEFEEPFEITAKVIGQEAMKEEKVCACQITASNSNLEGNSSIIIYTPKISSQQQQVRPLRNVLSSIASVSNDAARYTAGGGFALHDTCSRRMCGSTFTSFHCGNTKEGEFPLQQQEGKVQRKSSPKEYGCIVQKDSQRRENVTNFSRIRQKQVTRSRLTLVRIPREIDTRKTRTPVL